ncbi:MAG TPA: L-threonylcarbamoyladenylate synthase [Microlunatus sp.]|nr:L-threonylcarbamoyladenylate synthase [Microlunatus sp.]
MSEEANPGYRLFDCTDDDPVVIEEAAEVARQAVERGDCIVLPTDTVYGIGADAFSAEAVQGLLNAKNRGRDMPPPVLIADASLLRALTVDVPRSARDLVQKHWPGPLTIICKAQPSLRMDLGDTEGTIALRVPDHALARDVLRRTGPMAVSSANLSGQRAATTCQQAVDQLGDRVAVYLDGGARPWHGEPSTIVDFASTEDGVVLRKGALSVATIRETCPNVVDPDEPGPEPDQPQPDQPQPDQPADAAEPDQHPDAPEPDQPADAPGGRTEPAAAPVAEEAPAPVWSKDAGYSAAPEPDPAYHEPTTDELRITHSLEDPDQPSLFERTEGDAGGAPVDPAPVDPAPVDPAPVDTAADHEVAAPRREPTHPPES